MNEQERKAHEAYKAEHRYLLQGGFTYMRREKRITRDEMIAAMGERAVAKAERMVIRESVTTTGFGRVTATYKKDRNL